MTNSGPSRVLIDQTMLFEASRLLDGNAHAASWRVGPAEQLVHLSTLLDTVLLYDEVLVLDASLPDDADELTLRRVLLDRGILHSADTRPLATRVGNELTSFLIETGPPGRGHAPGHDVSARAVGEDVRMLLDPQAHVQELWAEYVVEVMHAESDDRMANYDQYGISTAGLRTDPLATLGSMVVEYIHRSQSGGRAVGVSHLRTFIYWRTAAHLAIPFVPSLLRLPTYHLITDHVRRSVQDRVYDVVADAFHATVGEVYADEAPLPLYLPPALSLSLDHLRTHRDIAAGVDELRRLGHEFRRALSQFQHDLDSSSSLGDARAARRRFNATLTALRIGLDTNHHGASGTIDQLLDIVPAVAKAAANPFDVVGYADALVRRPKDWIRSWWLRRPIRPALAISGRLDELGRYDQLLADATGLRCDQRQVDGLREQYGQALSLYGGEGRIPATASLPAPQREGKPTESP